MPESQSRTFVKLLEGTRKLDLAYQNRWMSPENWIKLIHKHQQVPDNIAATPKNLAYGIRGYYKTLGVAPHVWVPNLVGFYVAKNGTNNEVAYCSMPQVNKDPQLPTTIPAHINWNEVRTFDVNNLRVTRKRSRTMVSNGKLSETGSELPFRSPKGSRQRWSPRLATTPSSEMVSKPVITPNNTVDTSSSCVASAPDNAPDFSTWVFWSSPEAATQFGFANPKDTRDNDCVPSVVEQRIKLCKGCFQLPGGWRKLIEDLDSQDMYTEYDVHMLRWNCRYLARALEVALINMNEWKNWKRCCEQAIAEINEFEDWDFITCPQTIMRFHRKLRLNNQCFKNKHLASANKDKSRISSLFDILPEAKKKIKKFIRANLEGLLTEKVCSELHETILPKIAAKRKEELINDGVLEKNAVYGCQELLDEMKIPSSQSQLCTAGCEDLAISPQSARSATTLTTMKNLRTKSTGRSSFGSILPKSCECTGGSNSPLKSSTNFVSSIPH